MCESDKLELSAGRGQRRRSPLVVVTVVVVGRIAAGPLVELSASLPVEWPI